MPAARIAVLKNGRGVWLDAKTPYVPVQAPGGGTVPPPPAPGGAGMLVGASQEGQATWVAHQAQMGPWQIARSFNPGLFQATWDLDVSGPDVGRCASSFSAKPDLTLMGNGSYDALVTGFVQSIPDSHVVFLTIWHEPDVKERHGTLDPALFRPAFLRFCELVKAVGKPHVYTQLILSNYTFTAAGITTGLPDEFWVGGVGTNRLIDVVGFDTYMLSNSSGGGSAELANCIAYARQQGAAYAIPECGFSSTVTDMTAGAAWMHSVADYAFAQGSGPHTSCAYLTWFDTGNPPVPSSSPTLITASQQISTEYLTPYAAFVL